MNYHPALFVRPNKMGVTTPNQANGRVARHRNCGQRAMAIEPRTPTSIWPLRAPSTASRRPIRPTPMGKPSTATERSSTNGFMASIAQRRRARGPSPAGSTRTTITGTTPPSGPAHQPTQQRGWAQHLGRRLEKPDRRGECVGTARPGVPLRECPALVGSCLRNPACPRGELYVAGSAG